MKDAFTTGQVAEMFAVAPRTVAKWFDVGRLKGFRLPGSPDRRIPTEVLLQFAREYGLPLQPHQLGASVLLIYGKDPFDGGDPFDINCVLSHPSLRQHQVTLANDHFSIGLTTPEVKPNFVIVDLRGPIDCTAHMCLSLRRFMVEPALIIGLFNSLEESMRLEARGWQVDRRVYRPEDIVNIISSP